MLEILGGASHQGQAYLVIGAVMFCDSELVLRNITKLITHLCPEKVTAEKSWQERTVLKLQMEWLFSISKDVSRVWRLQRIMGHFFRLTTEREEEHGLRT